MGDYLKVLFGVLPGFVLEYAPRNGLGLVLVQYQFHVTNLTEQRAQSFGTCPERRDTSRKLKNYSDMGHMKLNETLRHLKTW